MTAKTKKLPALLDEATYPYPDTEYEHKAHTLRMDQIRKGDSIYVDGTPVEVGSVKTGTKWTELFEQSGTRITRLLNDTETVISRRRETPESRAATHRADTNRAILRDLQPDLGHDAEDRYWVKPVIEALDAAKVKTDKGWLLQHGDIDQILEAQAAAEIRANWLGLVEWSASGKRTTDDDEPWAGDLVDLLEEFISTLKDALSEKHNQRALSRSTSMTDNLMNDCLNEARSKFIYDAKWWRLR